MTVAASDQRSAQERPWHLSDALIPTTPQPIDDALAGSRDERNKPSVVMAPRAAPDAQPSAPLWVRILTGKSLTWRLRRVRNRIRLARRGAARRMSRWIRLHPEIRRAATTGTLHQLATDAIRRRSGVGVAGMRRYRPSVEVAGTLSVSVHRRSPLIEQVDVRSVVGSTDRTLVVTRAGPGLLDIRGPIGDLGAVLEPVDVWCWNPATFQHNPPTNAILALHGVVQDGESQRQRLDVAQRARAVVCDPDSRLTGIDRSRLIVQLACAGVPLVGVLEEADIKMIGGDLAAAINSAGVECYLDNRQRELHSLQLRRLARARHSPRGWWTTVGSLSSIGVRTEPSVSVLLPSDRPDDVIDAARSVTRQAGVDVQLAVGLHGAHMPAGLEGQLREVFPGELIVRRFDEDLTLGAVLNELTAAADGDLVSTWDDAAWYDSRHLADLVDALEYSGAGLVGKAAEFVFLETLDLTVRRLETGGERWSNAIEGGTPMLTRAELVETGWAEESCQVGRHLIEMLHGRGIYRCHGFGYVRRHSSPDTSATHNGAASDASLIRQASDQRPGLDLHFAGFEVDS